MKAKMVLVLMAVLAAVLLAVSLAFAGGKLLCVTQEQVKGEQTVNSCLAGGDKFAVVDEFGLVRVLSPEEVALSKILTPQAFEKRAFGIKEYKAAPWMVPLPIPADIPGG